jgi:hypothetical protein
VSYEGRQAMAFRTNAAGALVAFVGAHARGITIDGRRWEFADQNLPLVAWAPVAAERRVDGGAILQAVVHSEGVVRVPLADLPRELAVFAEGATPGSRGDLVVSRVDDDALVLEIKPSQAGRWLWVVPTAEAAQ